MTRLRGAHPRAANSARHHPRPSAAPGPREGTRAADSLIKLATTRQQYDPTTTDRAKSTADNL